MNGSRNPCAMHKHVFQACYWTEPRIEQRQHIVSFDVKRDYNQGRLHGGVWKTLPSIGGRKNLTIFSSRFLLTVTLKHIKNIKGRFKSL